MRSVRRLKRCWHDAMLDLLQCSHEKGSVIRLTHTANWQIGQRHSASTARCAKPYFLPGRLRWRTVAYCGFRLSFPGPMLR